MENKNLYNPGSGFAVHSALIAVALSITGIIIGAPRTAHAALGAFFDAPMLTKQNEVNVPYSVRSAISGDFGTIDGSEELIVVSTDGKIHVLRADGVETAVIETFGKVATVALGDLDGNGKGELVAGSAPGKCEVTITDVSGLVSPRTFTAYPNCSSGVSVAVGDFDGDGRAEIVTAPYAGGGAHIKVWNADASLRNEAFAFDTTYQGGANIAIGDVDNDGHNDVVVTKRSGKGVVTVLDGFSFHPEHVFSVISDTFEGGLNLAVRDVTNDGISDIIVIPENGGGPHAHVYGADGVKRTAFFTREEQYRGASVLVVARFSPFTTSLISFSGEGVGANPTLPQQIIVDYSEQRLYAFEYGVLVNSFLVSTGKNRATPMGQFSITDKPFKVYYAGPGYDLGWVPYNLRFKPSYYIHYAPWHNNFGQPMSHGCVNVNLENIKWIYEWADVGAAMAVVE